MASHTTVGKRFVIERLEERVAPASLIWQSGLYEAITAAWTSLFGSGKQNGLQLSSNQLVVSPEVFMCEVRSRTCSIPVEERVKLPAWAADFLTQVEQELDKSTLSKSKESAVHGIDAGLSPRLDELLTKVDRELIRAAALKGDGTTDTQEVRPLWAKELLREIQHEAAHV